MLLIVTASPPPNSLATIDVRGDKSKLCAGQIFDFYRRVADRRARPCLRLGFLSTAGNDGVLLVPCTGAIFIRFGGRSVGGLGIFLPSKDEHKSPLQTEIKQEPL
jgi:hypothetical protein